MAQIFSGKISFKPEIFTQALSKYYRMILVLLMLIAIGFCLFLVYKSVYDTVIVEKPINPSDLKSIEEKINIDQYTKVSNSLDLKIKHEAPNITTAL